MVECYAPFSNQGILVWDVSGPRVATNVVGATVPTILAAPVSVTNPPNQLSPNGHQFVIIWNKQSRGWHTEMRDGSNRLQYQIPMGVAPNYSFSPDGRALLVSDFPATFELRETATGRVRWKKTIGGAASRASAWQADSSAVAVDTKDEFHLLDARNGQELRVIKHDSMRDFALAPNGRRVYFIDADGKIQSQRLS